MTCWRKINISPNPKNQALDSLLKRVIAFYLKVGGNSNDFIAHQMNLDRRTIFKWQKQDDWKGRLELISFLFWRAELPARLPYLIESYVAGHNTAAPITSTSANRPTVKAAPLNAKLQKAARRMNGLSMLASFKRVTRKSI